MSSVSKQHLIFMPESGKSNFKLTADLKIQEKHDENSCASCQARKKSWFVNMQSVQVQNSILKQQAECSNAWKETINVILRGNVLGRTTDNDTIICLDEFDESDDNDIEEIHRPTTLPNLSPIPIVQSKKSTPSKTPNIPIRSTSEMSTPKNNFPLHLSNNSTNYNFLTPKDTDIPLVSTPSKKDLKLLENTILDPATARKFLASSKCLSIDHVFWVDPTNTDLINDRKKFDRLKSQVGNARVKGNFLLHKNLKHELSKKQNDFVSKYVEKVQLLDNHNRTYMPLDSAERDAIYFPDKTGQLFHLNSCPEQKDALENLKIIKSKVTAMGHIQNRFTPYVTNELFYREHMYKEKFLRTKTQSSSPKLSKESNMVDTPQLPKEKVNKQLLRQKMKSKKLKNKKKQLLKRLKFSTLTSTDEINDIEKADESSTVDSSCTRNNIVSNTPNRIVEQAYLSNQDGSLVSKTSMSPAAVTMTPIATPKSLRSNSIIIDTPDSNNESFGPKTPHKQAKFRPYRSLLQFPAD